MQAGEMLESRSVIKGSQSRDRGENWQMWAKSKNKHKGWRKVGKNRKSEEVEQLKGKYWEEEKERNPLFLASIGGTYLGSGRWSLGSGGCRRSQNGGGASFCCWPQEMGHCCPTTWETETVRIFFILFFARLGFFSVEIPECKTEIKYKKAALTYLMFSCGYSGLTVFGFRCQRPVAELYTGFKDSQKDFTT